MYTVLTMTTKLYFNLSQTGSRLLVLDVVLSILHVCGFNEQIFPLDEYIKPRNC